MKLFNIKIRLLITINLSFLFAPPIVGQEIQAFIRLNEDSTINVEAYDRGDPRLIFWPTNYITEMDQRTSESLMMPTQKILLVIYQGNIRFLVTIPILLIQQQL